MVRTIRASMNLETEPKTQERRRPLSGMAIIAVVLAFLPMCVPLNLLGTTLGFLAKRRIDLSGGAIGGRGAARAAIWGGVIMTVAGWWAWSSLTQWAEDMVRQQASETASAFMADIQKGDFESAATRWSPEIETPDATAMKKFATAVAVLGTVEGVGIRVMQPLSSDSITPVWSAGLIFNFSDAQLLGSARYDVLMGVTSTEEMVRLRRIVIDALDDTLSLPESP
jgi:hypothetical protein